MSNIVSRLVAGPWSTIGLQFALAITIAMCKVATVNGRVLVASNVLGGVSPIYDFDDVGSLTGTFDIVPKGGTLFSLATDGTRIIAGHDFNGFRDYSMDGTFRGQLPGLETPQAGAVVEFDSRGNIYLAGAGAPRRLNPDGTLSLTLPIPTAYGIDADAFGNIYVSLRPTESHYAVYKYSPSGTYLGIPAISNNYTDVAIDEVGHLLYVGTVKSTDAGPVGEIWTYDISDSKLEFIRSIPGPRYLTGISFDPISNHLLAANIFGGDVWEIDTYGAIVRRYLVPDAYPLDAIAIRVPEASTASLVLANIVVVGLSRIVRRPKSSTV